MRFSSTILCTLLVLATPAAAQTEITSAIESVTVYPDGATVTRVISVDLPQGDTTLIARDFKQAFEKCDVLLTPTAPTAAFAAGEKMDDPVTMYLNDMFTIPASMAGLPGISVPAGLDKDGLPLGLQLIGRAFDEETMLRAAAALEQAAGFAARPTGY